MKRGLKFISGMPAPVNTDVERESPMKRGLKCNKV